MTKRPKYAILADKLIKNILETQQPTNTRFFTEKELAHKYSVSRSTVRAALSELEDLKLIAKAKNVGYYVTYEPVRYDYAHFYSFSKLDMPAEQAPTTEILLFTQTIPNYYVAQMLHLAQDEPVYRVERLRLLGHQPVLFEKTFLPAERFPALKRNELVKNSLYDLLATKYQLKIKDGAEEFFASLINEREADLLDLRVGSPCLKIQRLAYDSFDRPFEFTITTAPSRYFAYKVPLTKDV